MQTALGCACITSQFTIWPLNVIGLQARNWSLRKKINSMIGIRVMISMLRNYVVCHQEDQSEDSKRLSSLAILSRLQNFQGQTVIPFIESGPYIKS